MAPIPNGRFEIDDRASVRGAGAASDSLRGHPTTRAALIYQHAAQARSPDLTDRLNLLVTTELEAAKNEAGADE